ncbi:phage terminase large subunit family protein [Candidatus Kaiserbacteria bacterium]|nr:phage terminase large subunit family protein [Candidatus Kaiserbacteria bacterium]
MEWADERRYLSGEASAEPGRWKTSRVEVARGVMLAYSDPQVHTITIMACTQLLKTEFINNVVAQHIDQDPCPIIVLQPSEKLGEAWSKDRLAPMLRDSPVLRGKVKSPRSRDSGNTILHKTFPGGHISVIGANAPSNLAMRPVRIVLSDEVDKYPHSAGTEGDPIALVEERAATFWNSKKVRTCSPTVKGYSRIEASYEESDKRLYYVPCPHCQEMQTLVWAQVKWEKDNPKTARYHCASCGKGWSEPERLGAIQKGEWRATAPFNGHAGFKVNKLASPWEPIPTLARKFLEAKKSPETLKAFINTQLAETWEEEGEGIEPEGLLARKENWGDLLPPGVVIITAGVDVQGDRLECEIIGWGIGEESWSLDYIKIYGDPGAESVWERLDVVLNRFYTHTNGTSYNITATCIDTGGHHTEQVYNFCKPRFIKGVYAIKGSSLAGRPVVNRKPTRVGRSVRLFHVGTDTAKELIYSRLAITEPGIGYCHFPSNYDAEYFKGLTSERVVTRYSHGRPKRVWAKDPGARNEPLDCRVYALAALKIVDPDIEGLADIKERKARDRKDPGKVAPKKQGSFINNNFDWKR